MAGKREKGREKQGSSKWGTETELSRLSMESLKEGTEGRLRFQIPLPSDSTIHYIFAKNSVLLGQIMELLSRRFQFIVKIRIELKCLIMSFFRHLVIKPTDRRQTIPTLDTFLLSWSIVTSQEAKECVFKSHLLFFSGIDKDERFSTQLTLNLLFQRVIYQRNTKQTRKQEREKLSCLEHQFKLQCRQQGYQLFIYEIFPL